MTWTVKQYNLDSHHVDLVAWIPPKTDPYDRLPASSSKQQSLWSTLTQEQKDYYNRQRAGYRMKSKIRRSIIAHNMRYMWTLTFKNKFIKDGNGNVKDTGDLSDIWKIWKAFLKRCHRKGLEFPYIVTIEMSEKRKEKYNEEVYHFHFCTNVFIHFNQKTARKFGADNVSLNMSDLWGHGYVYATNFKGDTKSAAANYLTKYVTKSFEEIEQKGARRYHISQGLNVDGFIIDQTEEIELDEYVYNMAKKKNCFFKKSYHCIDGGETEILVYTIFPKTKKKKKEQPLKEKKKKRWKSLEKSVPIKKIPEEEKEKCLYTHKALQLKLF